MIFGFVIAILVIWALATLGRRFAATTIGGLVIAVFLVAALGWPVLVGAIIVAAWRLHSAHSAARA